jgi:hypothetical protein
MLHDAGLVSSTTVPDPASSAALPPVIANVYDVSVTRSVSRGLVSVHIWPGTAVAVVPVTLARKVQPQLP